ncbi:MAG: hypothetical protein BAJATHORv1_50203 [Candidatus Thorarchaeota archaeon]|nr:MAG: hypothetical protein BAJATHORv1_50203 [Candidatus Thorarchaeota archaeon]
MLKNELQNESRIVTILIANLFILIDTVLDRMLSRISACFHVVP